MNRRKFLKSTTLAAAVAPLVVTQFKLFGASAPSNKLNLALIGTWGRGEAHFDSLATQNVVALCDVNEEHLAFGLKKFPGAKTYVDWRKLLDDHQALGLDGVVICSLDHTHAFISNWALNRNLHVYCEKPLANTVEEARLVRANYLSKKTKLATQVGMQRHAFQNFNRIRELIHDGAIGELTATYAWGNRQLRRSGYPPATGSPPSTLHYDLWLGPAPFHPYNPEYFSGKSGANCLQWNMYWDFGNGQVGDMGSHTMDLVWNVIDAKLPTSAEAKGDSFNPEVSPVTLETHFENPANDWRGPLRVSWYQGGAMPNSPKSYIDLNKIDHGAMFKGTKGFVVADFTSRIILPFGDDADLTYYKSRSPKKVLPPLGHFQQEWFDACKGSLKTSCDFDYSSHMIEQMLLGLVAYRAGTKIEYDGVAGRVTNVSEANAYLSHQYREGWTLNG
jgi:predicted dehydrogenase